MEILWSILKLLAWMEVLLLCCIAAVALADYAPDKLVMRFVAWLERSGKRGRG